MIKRLRSTLWWSITLSQIDLCHLTKGLILYFIDSTVSFVARHRLRLRSGGSPVVISESPACLSVWCFSVWNSLWNSRLLSSLLSTDPIVSTSPVTIRALHRRCISASSALSRSLSRPLHRSRSRFPLIHSAVTFYPLINTVQQ